MVYSSYISTSAEYKFLFDYAAKSCFDEGICRDRLRILWTAFCLHNHLDVDTSVYDRYLSMLWERVKETSDWHSVWDGSDWFENFMCAYLA